MAFAFMILLAIQVSGDQTTVTSDIWSKTPVSKVAEIDLPASVLDGNWKQQAGLKVNDLSDLSDLAPPMQKIVAGLAKQFEPIGVRSVADYTLVNIDIPLNTVTVRVFVFDNATKCKDCWKKKYEYEGWEKHYTKIDSNSARIVSSTQTNKMAMAFGNVWLTTHQLGKGEDHITAANHVLKLLTGGAKSLPQ